MPITKCTNCGGPYTWRWEEAFDKFGFGDGGGQVMSDEVLQVLRTAGYTPSAAPWGLHNVTIYSIKHDGAEQIPDNSRAGYANPRQYLPKAIVRLLDAKLGRDAEVEA